MAVVLLCIAASAFLLWPSAARPFAAAAREIPVRTAPIERLQIGVLHTVPEGCTRRVRPGDLVDLHYIGWVAKEGRMFDTSTVRRTPLRHAVGLGPAIPGIDKGIVGMCPGDVRKILIPSALGHTFDGNAMVPKNADLIYAVLLMSLEPGAVSSWLEDPIGLSISRELWGHAGTTLSLGVEAVAQELSLHAAADGVAAAVDNLRMSSDPSTVSAHTEAPHDIPVSSTGSPGPATKGTPGLVSSTAASRALSEVDVRTLGWPTPTPIGGDTASAELFARTSSTERAGLHAAIALASDPRTSWSQPAAASALSTPSGIASASDASSEDLPFHALTHDVEVEHGQNGPGPLLPSGAVDSEDFVLVTDSLTPHYGTFPKAENPTPPPTLTYFSPIPARLRHDTPGTPRRPYGGRGDWTLAEVVPALGWPQALLRLSDIPDLEPFGTSLRRGVAADPLSGLREEDFPFVAGHMRQSMLVLAAVAARAGRPVWDLQDIFDDAGKTVINTESTVPEATVDGTTLSSVSGSKPGVEPRNSDILTSEERLRELLSLPIDSLLAQGRQASLELEPVMCRARRLAGRHRSRPSNCKTSSGAQPGECSAESGHSLACPSWGRYIPSSPDEPAVRAAEEAAVARRNQLVPVLVEPIPTREDVRKRFAARQPALTGSSEDSPGPSPAPPPDPTYEARTGELDGVAPVASRYPGAATIRPLFKRVAGKVGAFGRFISTVLLPVIIFGRFIYNQMVQRWRRRPQGR